MATGSLPSETIGWVAFATGVTGIFALIFIALFYTVGNPFGTLNDIFNALMAISSGLLAWMLYANFKKDLTPLNQALLMLALIGALVAVAGSVLVIFKYTGWVLAGLYTASGYALIGLWVIGLNYAARQAGFLPGGMAIFGMVLGVIMLLGFAAIPGLIKGADSAEEMTALMNGLWQTASLGWLFLYPIWCSWLGRWTLMK